MPYRGAVRKVGVFSHRGYRQVFVKNYTIIYRIDEDRKMVVVVTVRYTPSSF
jgi:plasmid stabilization system protein ParE